MYVISESLCVFVCVCTSLPGGRGERRMGLQVSFSKSVTSETKVIKPQV